MNRLPKDSQEISKKKINMDILTLVAASVLLVLILTFIGISIGRSVSNADKNDGVSDSKPAVKKALPVINTEPEVLEEPSDPEIRGIYIATVDNINYPSSRGISADDLKKELDTILANCIQANLNTVYFQVRPTADAFYKSEIFPVSEYLTGTQGWELPDSFDPLLYLTEEAHKRGIKVHAWVNPLRVTAGTETKPKHDVNMLADGHPAKKHPEYTVPYADGRLYFDCGIPEVRTLIADGLREIVANYDVDGIIFDDYFYPYPVKENGKTAVFDDSETFAKYGGEMSLEDFRRDSVNKMIELCYNTVKETDPECLFGVAPAGIWQNNDGTNGGSDTAGMESYNDIYCDTVAWVEGRYVDYIAPQIYWSFTKPEARYDTLVRWWNALLDGTGIDLLISHGVYRYDDSESGAWTNPENELRCQVEFARSELCYKGSILYGYKAIVNNAHGLFDEVRDVFKNEKYHPDAEATDTGLIIGHPASGSYINLAKEDVGSFVLGTSDPTKPLYIDGEKVSRTKSGYFSLYLPLKDGENKFVFSHNGTETEYVLNRGKAPSSPGNQATNPTLDEPGIASVTPTYNWMNRGTLSVSATAPKGSKVTATLNGKTVSLTPTLNLPQENGKYMKEVYTGSFTLTATDGQIKDLGKVSFKSELNGQTYTAESASIRVIGNGASIPVEVINDDSEMKIERDSWYYDDFTAQSKGMRDNATLLSSGMYKLRCGGFVSERNIRELDGALIGLANVTSAEMTSDAKATYLKFKVSENIPINCNMENGVFTVSLYNINRANMPQPELVENPLFTAVNGKASAKANAYNYLLTLVNIENFYGFRHYYEDGYLIFEWRNPEKLPDTDKPLAGKTIVLDAGHGITNPNALGPLGLTEGAMNEADFNLEIVMATQPLLEELGATVIQIRDRDCEVDIPVAPKNDVDISTSSGYPYRVYTLIEADPDLAISIHQNSMEYSADVTKIRGVVGLYFADSGYMLTETVGESISTALNKLDRSPTHQRLAMVRNPKFPATLIETCFITSVEEYERMMQPDAVDTIAIAITDGVLEYYKRQESYLK